MPSYPYALTLTNPGAETGDTTGWTNVTGTLVSVTSGGSNSPVSGSRFFRAGASASTQAHQDVALPGDVLDDVDAGLLRADAAGWHAGADSDSDAGRLTLRFYDGSAVQLGPEYTMPSEHTIGGNNWRLRTLRAQVPPGTRTIRFTQYGIRTGGTNLDSYWDDFTLDLALPVTSDALLDIPDLDLWLRAGLVAGGSGDPVSTWADASGLGHDVTGSGATRPTVEPAGTFGLNDLATVYGDGSQHLAAADVGRYAGKPGLTVFAVVHADFDTATGGCIIGRDENNNRGWSLGLTPTDRRAQFIIATGLTTRAARAGDQVHPPGMPALLRARFNGATSEQALWVNGVADTGALDGTTPATIANEGPELRVFANGFDSHITGHVAELLVYGRALSDGECEAVEAVLLQQYALLQFEETVVSPAVDAHQGYATDGTEHWLSEADGGAINVKRRDADWDVIAQNTDPLNGLGGGLDHLGDCALHEGSLYVPAEDQDSPFNPHVLVFDAETLARTAAHDISATGSGFEPAALAVDPDRDLVWIGTFQSDWGKLLKYNLADMSFAGELELSVEIPYLQGLTYNPDDGYLYAAAGGDTEVGNQSGIIYQIDPDTGAARPIYRRLVEGSGVEAEGIDFTQGAFAWLIRESGSVEKVHFYGVLAPGSLLGPLIEASAVTHREALITNTQTLEGATSYRLYRSLTPGFTPGGGGPHRR